jgi:hypothetical protein
LGRGSVGLVQSAIHLDSGKIHAVKILELKLRKEVADIEKANMERLKNQSHYLVNLVECFDLVCGILLCFKSFLE